MDPVHLSVVLPCYNQAPYLQKNMQEIFSYLRAQAFSFEVLVVNDGSADGTKNLLGELQKEYPFVLLQHAKNLGKGQAVKTGVLAAQGTYILFLDADLAIPITETPKFLRILEDQPEVSIAIASRFVQGHRELVPVLWYRRILERGFSLLRRYIIGLSNIQDTQCGYKMFRREAARVVFSLMTRQRFSFDAEILFIAQKNKLDIQELPIALQNPVRTSLRLLRDSLLMLRDLILIRWQDMRGWYDAVPGAVRNITLDDFGINQETNKRILATLMSGRVARVAVMVDGEISDKEIACLKESGVALDVHLELPGEQQEHVMHGTVWVRGAFFMKRLLAGRLSPRLVATDWRRQVMRFQEQFGRLPDGLNSHEHTHFFPSLYTQALKVAREAGIPSVRFGQRGVFSWHPVVGILMMLRLTDRVLFGLPKKTSSMLVSLDWGVHPKVISAKGTEVLYHVERDEELVLVRPDFWR